MKPEKSMKPGKRVKMAFALALGFLAARAPVAEASVCGPGDQSTRFFAVWPADGAAEVPLDAGFRFSFEVGRGGIRPVHAVLETDGGEPEAVEAEMVKLGEFHTDAWVRPEKLEPLTEYTLTVSNDPNSPDDVVSLPVTVRFVTGEAALGDAPKIVLSDMLLESEKRTDRVCAGPVIDTCGGCASYDWVPYDDLVAALEVTASGPIPEGAYLTIQYTDAERTRTRYLDGLSADGYTGKPTLERLTDVAGEQLCVTATLTLPSGAASTSEEVCSEIPAPSVGDDQTSEAADDQTSEAADDQTSEAAGCTAGPNPEGRSGVLALLLLLGFFRVATTASRRSGAEADQTRTPAAPTGGF